MSWASRRWGQRASHIIAFFVLSFQFFCEKKFDLTGIFERSNILFLMDNQSNKIPLTKEGLEKLKQELNNLIEIKRPLIVERMASSRKIGDMAEESDYTQAKQELSFIDGRIDELQEVINKAIMIDEGHDNCQEVRLGCKITVQSNAQKHIFHLVGEWEADPNEARISHQSPLGQSLLGKKINEKVEVQAPAGKIVYTIVKID